MSSVRGEEKLGALEQHIGTLQSSKAIFDGSFKEFIEACHGLVAEGERAVSNENPLVLLLADGNSYVFKNHLLRAGAEGGKEAARLLSSCIQSTTAGLGIREGFRICVRVYANLTGLSDLLANGLQSIGSFVAGFNGAQALFDMVDSGADDTEDFKLAEAFRVFAGSPQCGHLIFAGCGNPHLGNLLKPYTGRRDKITLLRSASFSTEYQSMDLAIEEYPDVFESKLPDRMSAMRETRVPQAQHPLGKGFPDNGHHVSTSSSPNPSRKESDTKTLKVVPEDSTNLNKTEIRASSTGTQEPSLPSRGHSIKLPIPGPHQKLLIPVNKDGQRLDVHLPALSRSVVTEYHQRAEKQKLCNDFHLSKNCDKGTRCSFDHSPISEAVRQVQTHFAREWPCPSAHNCRDISCSYGHVCARQGCLINGKSCKLTSRMHRLSLDVAEWVSPGKRRQGNQADSKSDRPAQDSVHQVKGYNTRQALRFRPESGQGSAQGFETGSESEPGLWDEPKAVKSPLEEEDLIDLSDFDDTAPSKAM